jgi:hypothetical protein
VDPSYLHCQALVARGGQSSLEVIGYEEKALIQLMAKGIERVFPDQNNELIPDRPITEEDDFYIPFECLLSANPEYYRNPTATGTMSYLRCDNPASKPDSGDFCIAPIASFAETYQEVPAQNKTQT